MNDFFSERLYDVKKYFDSLDSIELKKYTDISYIQMLKQIEIKNQNYEKAAKLRDVEYFIIESEDCRYYLKNRIAQLKSEIRMKKLKRILNK